MFNFIFVIFKTFYLIFWVFCFSKHHLYIFPLIFYRKRHTKTKTLLSNLKSENPTLFALYPSWLSVTMHIQFPFVSKFDYSLSPTLPIPSQPQLHNTLHTTQLCKWIIHVHITELVCELNQKLEEKVQAWESQTPPPLSIQMVVLLLSRFFHRCTY